MKKVYPCFIKTKLLAMSMAVFGWMSGSMNASAVDFTFDMNNVGSETATIQITVEQNGDDLRFTVDQLDTDVSFADLRGVLFHINDSLVDVNDLDFTFVAATENITGNDITATLSPDITPVFALDDVDFSGFKNYDVLVEFGTPGEVPDDIGSIVFDISSISGGFLNLFTFMPVNMEEFLAVRYTSVWSEDDPNREGSGKGICCGTTVAEPSSTLGFLAFAMGGLLWRRRLAS